MRAGREVECRSCGRVIHAGEECHVVLGGLVQCCGCYDGPEPCAKKEVPK